MGFATYLLCSVAHYIKDILKLLNQKPNNYNLR